MLIPAARLAAVAIVVVPLLAHAQDRDPGVIQSVDINGRRDVIGPRALLRVLLAPGTPADVAFFVDGTPARVLVTDRLERLVEAPDTLSGTPTLEVRDSNGVVLGSRLLRRLPEPAAGPRQLGVQMSFEREAAAQSVVLTVDDDRVTVLDVTLQLNTTPRLRLRQRVSQRGRIALAPEGNVWTPGAYIVVLVAPLAEGNSLRWERVFVVGLDGTLASPSLDRELGPATAARYAQMFRDIVDAVAASATKRADVAARSDELQRVRAFLSRHCQANAEPAPAATAYARALQQLNELVSVPFPYSPRLCTIAASLLAAVRPLLLPDNPDVPSLSSSIETVPLEPTGATLIDNLLAAFGEIDSIAKGR